MGVVWCINFLVRTKEISSFRVVVLPRNKKGESSI